MKLKNIFYKITLLTLLSVQVQQLLAQSPGGVSSGLVGWYKEAAANTGTVWKNATGSNDAAGTGTNVYNTSGSDLVNFNPSYTFDASGTFTLPAAIDVSGSYTVLGVAKLKTAGSNGRVFGSANSNVIIGYYSNLMNAVYYDGAPNSLSSGTNSVTSSTTDVRNYTYVRSGGPFAFYGNSTSILTGASSGATAFRGSIGGSSGQNSSVVIPEFITYNTALSAANQNRVESYLAVKYGFTKSGNYVHSSGTTIWTSGGGYDNDIAGIGRDDASGLTQKQSQSTNAGIQPIIGAGGLSATNAANGGSFSQDQSFMIWGDDGGSTRFVTAISGIAGINNRMTSIWKVQVTGSGVPSSVTVSIPASSLPGSVSNPMLLVSSTTSFSSTSTQVPMGTTTVGGVLYYTCNTTALTNGQFFTFAGYVSAPGGVNNNLGWWYRGDAGFSSGATTTWLDGSANGLDLTQSSASLQPASTNYQNFNPVVSFDGSDALNNATGYWKATTGNTAFNAFAVTRHTSGTGSLNALFTENTSIGIQSLFNDYNGNIYNVPGWSGSYAYASFTTAMSDVPQLLTTRFNSTNSTRSVAANGLSQSVTQGGGYTTFNGSSGNLVIGNHPNQSSWPYQGDIAEIILYGADNSTANINRIQSYLALKWGLTLDQTTPQNYVSSAGTTIWNASLTTGFNKDIAGIGLDSASGLNQKQSASVNSGLQPVISVGALAATNAANTGSFTADQSYMIWADSGGSTQFIRPISGIANINNRMANVWQVQRSGSGVPATVTVALPVNALPGNVSNIILLVSSTNSFSSASTQVPLNATTTAGGVTYYTASTNALTNGQFFTFAGYVSAPGGVGGNLSFWYRGDAGVTQSSGAVSQWTDAANGYAATQSTGTAQPTYNGSSNLFNYNPTLSFNGSQNLRTASTLPGVSTALNTYAVYIPTAGTSNYIWNWSSGGNTGHTYYNNNAATNNLQVYLQNFGWLYPTTTSLITTPGIASVNWNNTSPGTITIRQNGVTTATGATTSVMSGIVNGSSQVNLGGVNSTGYNGRLAEVIGYNSSASAAQLQQIQSYLAIKYGITLDQTTPQNYVSSAGTTIWNASLTTGFNKDIAGIGLDSASGLNQKQSASVNSGLQPVISVGALAATNAANTGSFTADQSYMIWADSGGSTQFIRPISGIANINNRMANVWQVQRSGSGVPATVTVALPVNALPGNVSNIIMLVSGTNSFSSASTQVPLNATTTAGGVTYYTASTNALTNGQFFTFAGYVSAPGGVGGNLSFWYRGDAGVTQSSGAVSQWTDAANGYAATQSTGTAQPTYNSSSNLFNYNPTLNFNGSQNLKTTSTLPGATTGINTYVVYVPTTGTSSWIWNWASSGYGMANYYNNSATDGFRGYTDNHSYIYPTTGLVTTPTVSSINWNNTSPGTFTVRNNGLSFTPISSTTALTTIINGSSYFNAGGTAGSTGYHGQIAEVIGYNASASATQRLQIESYLALKYGITLDQTTAQNYLNSAGGVIWNASLTTGFNKDIAGIGLDSASGLNQKQSASVNSGFQPIISVGSLAATNVANTGSFTADQSYMIWADSGGSTQFIRPISGIANINNRMANVWQVQRSGSGVPAMVYVSLPASQITVSNPMLLVSSTNSFSSASTQVPLNATTTVGGVTYYTASTTALTNGQFFTFGGYATAPGGVSAGLQLWLKPETAGTTTDNTAVSTWTNAAGRENLVAPSGTVSPLYRSNAANLWNFNPTVVFDGTDDYMVSANYNASNLTTGTMGDFAVGDKISTIAVALPGASGSQCAMAFGENQFISPYLNGGQNSMWPMSNYSGVDRRGQRTIYFNYLDGTAPYHSTNGVKVNFTSGTTSLLPSNVRFTISNDWDGTTATEPLQGPWPEMIMYRGTMTDADRNKIESYLAIKWGLTLGTTASPATYVNSAGTTIWSAAANTYHNNVAGIGLDSASTLYQKQSQTVNSGSQVVIGLGSIAASNSANTNSFSTDRSFDVWGDNAQPLTYATAVTNNLPTGMNFANRMSRIWRVQETGTVGSVQVAMRSAAVAGGDNAYLIVSNDPTFATGNTWYPLNTALTINGNIYYGANVDFTSGTQYFTFAVKLIGPGGVAGSSLWLRADQAGSYTDGNSVSNWDDVSVNDNDGVQATTANQPTFGNNSTDNINFNQVVKFNGTTQVLNGSNSVFGSSSYNSSSVFGALRGDAAAGTLFSEALGTGSAISLAAPNASSNVVWNGPTTSAALSTAWGGTLGTPYMWAGWNVNGNTPRNVIRRNGLQLTSGTGAGAYTGNNSIPTIGASLNGRVGELVVFSTALSATQRQQVESYLALKYGLTLDQTTAQNYLNSQGATIWNGTTNSTYRNNIAGIGRDDASALSQKQSQSVNSGSQVVVSTGTAAAASNTANATAIASDLQYLIWGNDNGSITTTTPVYGFGAAALRLTRVWALQNTGSFNQQVTVYYPTSALNTGLGSSAKYLVYNDSANFNGTVKATVASSGTTTINGTGYTAFTVTFPTTGTLYFSFGVGAPAPVLSAGNPSCSGNGTYSVTFSSNGVVTASPWTVSGNTVSNINVGTDVVLTATSNTSGATTVITVNSPTSCPSSGGCIPPAISAGNGVCNGTGSYNVAVSATSGSTITANAGTVSGNIVTGITIGTNVTITATLNGCSSSVTVSSPYDCNSPCLTPSASYGSGICSGSTYNVGFVKTSTSTVTASAGTVTGGGTGSTSGTISGITANTSVTTTVAESGCSNQVTTLAAPSPAAPTLTIGSAVCSGTGTYSVSFNSNGIVTASAGTVSGNTISGIPTGTNVTVTAISVNGCGTTTAQVTSPSSCPVSSPSGCVPPGITAGQGVCAGGGLYSVVFSATSGASITTSAGTVSGNTVINIPTGTNLTITATLGTGCSSSVIVNSPADCSTPCATPSASFTSGTCSGSTYTVSFVKTSTSTVTASTGTVTGGGTGSTSGTISGIAAGTAVTTITAESGCSTTVQSISAPSATAPTLTISNAVCSGTGTYSVTFNSNGIVTASAGIVSGNTVSGIPTGTNVTITASATNGCATTTAQVSSPSSCPVSSPSGCVPPSITAGQGVCAGGGVYSVAFSATSGATISTNAGVVAGNTITGITVGSSVTITATLATGCSSSVTVNSPADCSTTCATPSASFTSGTCSGSTYTVNFVKTSTSTVTASTGTVTGGGTGSTFGTISGIATGTPVTSTTTEPGCSVQTNTIAAPSTVAPVLSVNSAVCTGTGTYSVDFNSDGVVTASAGTVSGNTVTGIPTGTNVTLTATSVNGCATTTAAVTSPASCPSAGGCIPPNLTAGQGVCNGTGTYNVAFSVAGTATISVSAGTLSGSTVTGIPIGTSLMITATSSAGCTSTVTVNSPADCNNSCATPSASFTSGSSFGSTYTVTFVKTSTSTVTATTGTVTGGGAGSTSGTISGVALGTDVTTTVIEPSCSTRLITITSPKYIAVSLRAYLQGAMSGTNMKTTLRTNSLIPRNHPYSGGTWAYSGKDSVTSAAAIPSKAVDWVLVELRSASSPSTIVAARAAFLLNNGNIVDLDSVSSLKFTGVAAGSYFISVRHRNHLGIRTPSAIAMTLNGTATSYDFSTAQAQAYQNSAITTNAALKDMGNGIFAMWGGDANGNGKVSYQGLNNDLTALSSTLGGNLSTTLSNVYRNADLNFTGTVSGQGLNNDQTFLTSNVLSNLLTAIYTAHL